MKRCQSVSGIKFIRCLGLAAGYGLAVWTGMDTANITTRAELLKRIRYQLVGVAVVSAIGIIDVVLGVALILRTWNS